MAGPAFTSRGAGARRLLSRSVALAGVAVMLELWHCPVAALLGVPCPGCGMTRAAIALARGDLGRAVTLHPLSPLVLPWLGLMASSALARDSAAPGAGEANAGDALRLGPARLVGMPRSLLGAIGRSLERATPVVVALLLGVWLARFLGAFGGPVPVSSLLLG